MVDLPCLTTFWGEKEYRTFYDQIKRVFPDREPVELQLDHPISHCVFDLKEKPQVPNVDKGIESQYTGITWERSDAKEVHTKPFLTTRTESW